MSEMLRINFVAYVKGSQVHTALVLNDSASDPLILSLQTLEPGRNQKLDGVKHKSHPMLQGEFGESRLRREGHWEECEVGSYRLPQVLDPDTVKRITVMHEDGSLIVVWSNNGSAGSDQSSSSVQGRRFSWGQVLVPMLSPTGLVGLFLLLLGAGSAFASSRSR